MSLLVQGNNPAAIKTAERNIFTATAGQTIFNIIQGYQPGDIDVFLNGVRLVDGEDFSASNGVSVTLTSGASVGDSVVVVCFRPFQVADFYTKSEQDARYVNTTGDTMTGVHRHNSYLAIGKGPANNDQITWNAIPDNAGNYTPHWAGSSDAGGTIIGMPYGGGGGLEIRTLRHGTSGNTRVQSDYPVRMSIDDSGRITMPYQPMFMAHNSSGHQTSNTAEIMAFVNTVTNIGNCYNTTTYRFTAPIGGTYRFSKSYMTYAGNHERTQFRKNGVGVGDQSYTDTATATGSYNRGCYEIIITLAAGDYIEVWRNVGNETATASHVAYRHFCGQLIG